MKSFTDLFIRRPVLAIVVNLVILIAGFQAIRSLNVRQYPRSENATVTVTTAYIGASAELVRGFITQPLERAIAAADGIEYLESNSKLGLSTITVWLKADRLAAYGINPNEVRQALAANNFLSAIGRTKGSLVQVNLTANTDLRSVDEFKQLVIRHSGDSYVRLGDVADVALGAEDYDSEVRFTGERAVFMGIWVLPNANSLDVIKRARVEMESIQKDLPSGLKGRM